MRSAFQTIVLGLGAMGSSALYHLARRGNKVLGIDQFRPPHSFGSTHGDTRITRQAIGEGNEYVPFALRSYELWREMEKETGRNLLTITGGLILTSGSVTGGMHGTDLYSNTVKAANLFDIKHELFDAKDLRKRFPQFKIADDDVAYYEYEAGFLRPEYCVETQLLLAQNKGALIRCDEKVIAFEEANGLMIVRTDLTEYDTEQLIVTAGPWLPDLIPDLKKDIFSVTRQVMYWFQPDGNKYDFSVGKFPVFIWQLKGKIGFYGFPISDSNVGVKIATEQFSETTTPSAINKNVSHAEIQAMFENYVQPHFDGISNLCTKAVTCLYTTTPDFGFVIDRHPRFPAVIIASPCSGHGFKHSSAIGEALSELVIEGKSNIDLRAFSFDRFAK